MKPRSLFSVLVTASLLLVAATAALAQDYPSDPTMSMSVEAQVLPAGALGLHVQDGVGFGPVATGAISDPHDFHFEVVNMTSDGWQVDVTTLDFFRGYVENCDDFGCDGPYASDNPAITFPGSSLWVYGGDWSNQPQQPQYVTASTAQGTGTIMTATAGAYGHFGFDPGPWVELHVPSTVTDHGNYYSSVTFTISSVIP